MPPCPEVVGDIKRMRVRNIAPNAIPHGIKVSMKYKTLVDLTWRTVYGKVHIIRKDFVDHPVALPLKKRSRQN